MSANETGSELVITHQLLSGDVYTTRERVFWGNLLGNLELNPYIPDWSGYETGIG